MAVCPVEAAGPCSCHAGVDELVDDDGPIPRQNVVAGADCGMGRRAHSEIGWAKLAALAEGAALAAKPCGTDRAPF
jgi:hypothetical protein